MIRPQLAYQQKIVFYFWVTSVGCLLAGLIAGNMVSSANLKNYDQQKIDTQMKMIAESISAAVAFDDWDVVQQTIAILKNDPSIISACVYDRHNNIVVTEGDGSCPAEVTFQNALIWRPLTFKKVNIGMLGIAQNSQHLQETFAQQNYAFIGIFVMCCAIILVFSRYIRTPLVKPIQVLIQHIRDGMGKQDVVKIGYSKDEVYNLQQMVLEMLDYMQQIRGQLVHYKETTDANLRTIKFLHKEIELVDISRRFFQAEMNNDRAGDTTKISRATCSQLAKDIENLRVTSGLVLANAGFSVIAYAGEEIDIGPFIDQHFVKVASARTCISVSNQVAPGFILRSSSILLLHLIDSLVEFYYEWLGSTEADLQIVYADQALLYKLNMQKVSGGVVSRLLGFDTPELRRSFFLVSFYAKLLGMEKTLSFTDNGMVVSLAIADEDMKNR